MKQNTKTKFQFMAAIAALLIAPHAFAQSIIVQAGAVVAGKTTIIPLEFVAGGGATNFDFVMDYNPDVVDESSLDFTCTSAPTAVGLTEFDCEIDKIRKQVRGIGVNSPPLPLNSLISGVFAEISMPIKASAPIDATAFAFASNFASGITTNPYDFTWTPKLNDSYCNGVLLSGGTTGPTELHEACELLVVGSDFSAQAGSSVFLSSGLAVDISTGAVIETGATLSLEVCGQSLCEISPDPMPNGCHSCVVQICDLDPACCESAYTESCLYKVSTVCELVCEPQL